LCASHHGLRATLVSAVAYTLLALALTRSIPLEALIDSSPGLLELLPHLTALANGLALTFLSLGWWFIRRGQVARHRAAMLAALASILGFLALYVTRVSLTGVTPFPGPEWVYRLVYLPVLGVHIALSAACLPLVLYNAITGLSLKPEQVPRTGHVRVGPWAVKLWLLSLALGQVVYVLQRLAT
jgi:putative membrane protein